MNFAIPVQRSTNGANKPEVMGSNPVRAWIFFRSYYQLLVSVVFLAARISQDHVVNNKGQKGVSVNTFLSEALKSYPFANSIVQYMFSRNFR